MKFDIFEDMYKMLWEALYKILAIFGIVKNGEGNLEEVPEEE